MSPARIPGRAGVEPMPSECPSCRKPMPDAAVVAVFCMFCGVRIGSSVTTDETNSHATTVWHDPPDLRIAPSSSFK